MELDNLDKILLQHLCKGISSYEELARICGVTRNTVYRRIAALENQGIIKSTVRCIVNLNQLDITPICIEVKVAQSDLNKAASLLTAHRNVRLLLRSYGDYNLNALAYCTKGKEGEVIHSIGSILEEFMGVKMSVSVGFVWEKVDLESFNDQLQTENRIRALIEAKN